MDRLGMQTDSDKREQRTLVTLSHAFESRVRDFVLDFQFRPIQNSDYISQKL